MTARKEKVEKLIKRVEVDKAITYTQAYDIYIKGLGLTKGENV
jgi:hypothetical protein